MRIKSFAINNFRGITGGLDKNIINFDDSNTIFVFGQNNVGKSSILKAYESFYLDSITEKDLCNSNSDDIEIEIEFYIDEATDKSVIEAKGGNKYKNLKNKYLNDRGVLKLKKTFSRTDRTSSNQTFNIAMNDYENISYGGIGSISFF